MAESTAEKVFTVESLEEFATLQKTYIDTAVKKAFKGLDLRTGCNKQSTIFNVPTSSPMCVVTLNSSGTFGLDGELKIGEYVHVIVINGGVDIITVNIPNSFKSPEGSVLELEPNTFGEINAVSDGTDVYVRVTA